MKSHQITKALRGLFPCIGVTLAIAGLAQAGSRRFTYSYETTTMAAGAMELESSVTWKTQQADDPGVDAFDIRHEFEYGMTDRLQLALYFTDWQYKRSNSTSSNTNFGDVAFEAIYNLTDPNTTPFGSALYGELKGSNDFIELEAKLLLQKNIGSWIFVYNIGGEIAWENDYRNNVAELMQSAGVSYQINPNWSVGTELLHEIAVPNVDSIGDSGVFFGPNVSWRSNRFSVALTGLWQLTSLAGEPDFQLRSIISFDF